MKLDAILNACALHKDRDVGVFAMHADGVHDVFVLLDGTFFHYDAGITWIPTTLATARYRDAADFVIVTASAEGDTWEIEPKSRVRRTSRIAPSTGGITRLAAVDDAIWACGMGRVAWRREADGSWTDVSAPEAALHEGVIGFTDIASLRDERVVAVGWAGEIWIRVGEIWSREPKASKANFNAVSVGADGEAVIVGDRGAIVVGRPGAWRVVEGGVSDDLFGVCHFGGEIFVASPSALFRFRDDALVPETRFADADARPRTCLNFAVAKDCVFSQGERDIVRFDGAAWSRVL